MKKIIILIIVIFSGTLKAQKIKKLDSITFKEVEKLLGNMEYKNNVEIYAYKTKSGDWLKKGDTLVIGKPSNANNIETNKISGIRISKTNHTHVFLGTIGAMMMGTAMFGNESMTGDKILITKMLIGRFSRKNPFKAGVEFKKVGGGSFLGTKKMGRSTLEPALESGEIINKNRGITRLEAIDKLREAKELLNLEMISKVDFDKLKKELAPVIMKNKNN